MPESVMISEKMMMQSLAPNVAKPKVIQISREEKFGADQLKKMEGKKVDFGALLVEWGAVATNQKAERIEETVALKSGREQKIGYWVIVDDEGKEIKKIAESQLVAKQEQIMAKRKEQLAAVEYSHLASKGKAMSSLEWEVVPVSDGSAELVWHKRIRGKVDSAHSMTSQEMQSRLTEVVKAKDKIRNLQAVLGTKLGLETYINHETAFGRGVSQMFEARNANLERAAKEARVSREIALQLEQEEATHGFGGKLKTWFAQTKAEFLGAKLKIAPATSYLDAVVRGATTTIIFDNPVSQTLGWGIEKFWTSNFLPTVNVAKDKHLEIEAVSFRELAGRLEEKLLKDPITGKGIRTGAITEARARSAAMAGADWAFKTQFMPGKIAEGLAWAKMGNLSAGEIYTLLRSSKMIRGGVGSARQMVELWKKAHSNKERGWQVFAAVVAAPTFLIAEKISPILPGGANLVYMFDVGLMRLAEEVQKYERENGVEQSRWGHMLHAVETGITAAFAFDAASTVATRVDNIVASAREFGLPRMGLDALGGARTEAELVAMAIKNPELVKQEAVGIFRGWQQIEEKVIEWVRGGGSEKAAEGGEKILRTTVVKEASGKEAIYKYVQTESNTIELLKFDDAGQIDRVWNKERGWVILPKISEPAEAPKEAAVPVAVEAVSPVAEKVTEHAKIAVHDYVIFDGATFAFRIDLVKSDKDTMETIREKVTRLVSGNVDDNIVLPGENVRAINDTQLLADIAGRDAVYERQIELDLIERLKNDAKENGLKVSDGQMIERLTNFFGQAMQKDERTLVGEANYSELYKFVVSGGEWQGGVDISKAPAEKQAYFLRPEDYLATEEKMAFRIEAGSNFTSALANAYGYSFQAGVIFSGTGEKLDNLKLYKIENGVEFLQDLSNQKILKELDSVNPDDQFVIKTGKLIAPAAIVVDLPRIIEKTQELTNALPTDVHETATPPVKDPTEVWHQEVTRNINNEIYIGEVTSSRSTFSQLIEARFAGRYENVWNVVSPLLSNGFINPSVGMVVEVVNDRGEVLRTIQSQEDFRYLQKGELVVIKVPPDLLSDIPTLEKVMGQDRGLPAVPTAPTTYGEHFDNNGRIDWNNPPVKEGAYTRDVDGNIYLGKVMPGDYLSAFAQRTLGGNGVDGWVVLSKGIADGSLELWSVDGAGVPRPVLNLDQIFPGERLVVKDLNKVLPNVIDVEKNIATLPPGEAGEVPLPVPAVNPADGRLLPEMNTRVSAVATEVEKWTGVRSFVGVLDLNKPDAPQGTLDQLIVPPDMSSRLALAMLALDRTENSQLNLEAKAKYVEYADSYVPTLAQVIRDVVATGDERAVAGLLKEIYGEDLVLSKESLQKQVAAWTISTDPNADEASRVVKLLSLVNQGGLLDTEARGQLESWLCQSKESGLSKYVADVPGVKWGVIGEAQEETASGVVRRYTVVIFEDQGKGAVVSIKVEGNQSLTETAAAISREIVDQIDGSAASSVWQKIAYRDDLVKAEGADYYQQLLNPHNVAGIVVGNDGILRFDAQGLVNWKDAVWAGERLPSGASILRVWDGAKGEARMVTVDASMQMVGGLGADKSDANYTYHDVSEYVESFSLVHNQELVSRVNNPTFDVLRAELGEADIATFLKSEQEGIGLAARYVFVEGEKVTIVGTGYSDPNRDLVVVTRGVDIDFEETTTQRVIKDLGVVEIGQEVVLPADYHAAILREGVTSADRVLIEMSGEALTPSTSADLHLFYEKYAGMVADINVAYGYQRAVVSFDEYVAAIKQSGSLVANEVISKEVLWQAMGVDKSLLSADGVRFEKVINVPAGSTLDRLAVAREMNIPLTDLVILPQPSNPDRLMIGRIDSEMSGMAKYGDGKVLYQYANPVAGGEAYILESKFDPSKELVAVLPLSKPLASYAPIEKLIPISKDLTLFQQYSGERTYGQVLTGQAEKPTTNQIWVDPKEMQVYAKTNDGRLVPVMGARLTLAEMEKVYALETAHTAPMTSEVLVGHRIEQNLIVDLEQNDPNRVWQYDKGQVVGIAKDGSGTMRFSMTGTEAGGVWADEITVDGRPVYEKSGETGKFVFEAATHEFVKVAADLHTLPTAEFLASFNYAQDKDGQALQWQGKPVLVKDGMMYVLDGMGVSALLQDRNEIIADLTPDFAFKDIYQKDLGLVRGSLVEQTREATDLPGINERYLLNLANESHEKFVFYKADDGSYRITDKVSGLSFALAKEGPNRLVSLTGEIVVTNGSDYLVWDAAKEELVKTEKSQIIVEAKYLQSQSEYQPFVIKAADYGLLGGSAVPSDVTNWVDRQTRLPIFEKNGELYVFEANGWSKLGSRVDVLKNGYAGYLSAEGKFETVSPENPWEWMMSPFFTTQEKWGMFFDSLTMVNIGGSLWQNIYPLIGGPEDILPANYGLRYDNAPFYLIAALSSSEDKFMFRNDQGENYNFHSANLMRMVLDQVNDVLGIGQSTGGSTITQQTVKQLAVSPEDLRSTNVLVRKLGEWVAGEGVARIVEPEKVMTTYINTVPTIGGVGLESGSMALFGKDVNELTLPESALLAVHVNSPMLHQIAPVEGYAVTPRERAEIWGDKAAGVIRRMEANGVLSEAERAEATQGVYNEIFMSGTKEELLILRKAGLVDNTVSDEKFLEYAEVYRNVPFDSRWVTVGDKETYLDFASYLEQYHPNVLWKSVAEVDAEFYAAREQIVEEKQSAHQLPAQVTIGQVKVTTNQDQNEVWLKGRDIRMEGMSYDAATGVWAANIEEYRYAGLQKDAGKELSFAVYGKTAVGVPIVRANDNKVYEVRQSGLVWNGAYVMPTGDGDQLVELRSAAARETNLSVDPGVNRQRLFVDLQGNYYESKLNDDGSSAVSYVGRVYELGNEGRVLLPIAQIESTPASQYENGASWTTLARILETRGIAVPSMQTASTRPIVDSITVEANLADLIGYGQDPRVNQAGALDSEAGLGVEPQGMAKAIEKLGLEATPLEFTQGNSRLGEKLLKDLLVKANDKDVPVMVWVNPDKHAEIVASGSAGELSQQHVGDYAVLVKDIVTHNGKDYVYIQDPKLSEPRLLAWDDFVAMAYPDAYGRFRVLAMDKFDLSPVYEAVRYDESTKEAQVGMAVASGLIYDPDNVAGIENDMTINPDMQRVVASVGERSMARGQGTGFYMMTFDQSGNVNANVALDGNGTKLPFSATQNEGFATGSVWKIVTAAYGLANGLDPNKRLSAGDVTYDTSGDPLVYNWTMDSKTGQLVVAHGADQTMTISQILRESSNTGAFGLVLHPEQWDGARDLNPTDFYSYMNDRGLLNGGEFASNGFVGVAGTASKEQVNYYGEYSLFAMGQGAMRTSSYDMSRIVLAIMNKGQLLNPNVVVGNKSEVVGDLGLSATDMAAIKQGMLEVTTHKSGTAYQVFKDVKGYTVYAKTGTAEAGEGKLPNSWFVGYAEDKQGHKLGFSLVIPHGGEGSAIAAPAVREVLDQYFAQANSLAPHTTAENSQRVIVGNESNSLIAGNLGAGVVSNPSGVPEKTPNPATTPEPVVPKEAQVTEFERDYSADISTLGKYRERAQLAEDLAGAVDKAIEERNQERAQLTGVQFVEMVKGNLNDDQLALLDEKGWAMVAREYIQVPGRDEPVQCMALQTLLASPALNRSLEKGDIRSTGGFTGAKNPGQIVGILRDLRDGTELGPTKFGGIAGNVYHSSYATEDLFVGDTLAVQYAGADGKVSGHEAIIVGKGLNEFGEVVALVADSNHKLNDEGNILVDGRMRVRWMTTAELELEYKLNPRNFVVIRDYASDYYDIRVIKNTTEVLPNVTTILSAVDVASPTVVVTPIPELADADLKAMAEQGRLSVPDMSQYRAVDMQNAGAMSGETSLLNFGSPELFSVQLPYISERPVWVKPTKIVLHWAGNGSEIAPKEKWTSDWVVKGLIGDENSSHFAVGVDGVRQLVPMKETGIPVTNATIGYDQVINIEASGLFRKGRADMTEAEFNNIVDLVVRLEQTYGLTVDDIVGHQQYDLYKMTSYQNNPDDRTKWIAVDPKLVGQAGYILGVDVMDVNKEDPGEAFVNEVREAVTLKIKSGER